jgi:hypothetical protein
VRIAFGEIDAEFAYLSQRTGCESDFIFAKTIQITLHMLWYNENNSGDYYFNKWKMPMRCSKDPAQYNG